MSGEPKDPTPTRARLNLLQHIDVGNVRKDPCSLTPRYEMRDTRDTRTARVTEVIAAKWARVENYDVVLTELGRSVLKGDRP